MELDSNLREKKIASQNIFSGKVINVRVDTVLLPNGNKATREVVEHPGAVAIIPVNEKNKIIMVRQYRQPAGEVLLELPAGKKDQGEAPLVCARRELEEETGYVAREWKELFSFYTTPGFSNELLHLILAKGLEKKEAHPDSEEFLDITEITLNQALKMIFDGQIRDGKTVIGLLTLHFLEAGGIAF